LIANKKKLEGEVKGLETQKQRFEIVKINLDALQLSLIARFEWNYSHCDKQHSDEAALIVSVQYFRYNKRQMMPSATLLLASNYQTPILTAMMKNK